MFHGSSVLTVDDEGEVAVVESGDRDGNAPLVEPVVDPLASSGGHVQDPLHRILRAAADQVPVHHPLTVLQPVLGPHHAGAVAGQHHLRPGRDGEVLGLHHHAETAAAAALSPRWNKHVTTCDHNQTGNMKRESFRACSELKVSPPGRKSTARTETDKNTNVRVVSSFIQLLL